MNIRLLILICVLTLAGANAQAEYVPMPLYGTSVVESAADSRRVVYAQPRFAQTTPVKHYSVHRPYFNQAGPFFRPARLESLGARSSYSSNDNWRGKRYGYTTHWRNPYRLQ